MSTQAGKSQAVIFYDEKIQSSKQLSKPGFQGSLRYICRICYNSNPGEVELELNNCLCPKEHETTEQLSVLWSQQKCRWIHVRPVPEVTIPGWFILCNEWSCGGKDCTYAHNKEELIYWNSILQEQRLMRKRPGNVIGTLLVTAFGRKETLSSLSILQLYLCNTV